MAQMNLENMLSKKKKSQKIALYDSIYMKYPEYTNCNYIEIVHYWLLRNGKRRDRALGK